jgi:hypothetical protein
MELNSARLGLSLGSNPFKIAPLCNDTDPSAVATVGTRAGSPGLKAYQGHSAIPAESPPLRQNGDPLASASSSGREISRNGPNLVSKVDEEV